MPICISHLFSPELLEVTFALENITCDSALQFTVPETIPTLFMPVHHQILIDSSFLGIISGKC